MKFLITAILLFTIPAFSQTPDHAKTAIANTTISKGLSNAQNIFVENIGQYSELMVGYTKMGKIKYGFEGFGLPVLFTARGLVHLQQRVEKISKEQEEKLERKKVPEEEIERKRKVTRKVITMQWLGANPQPEIIAEEVTHDHHTYGLLKKKARGFKKITYKDLYPGVDVIYHFTNTGKPGFEYSLVVKPGADLSLVKMKYSGDVKKITINKDGTLLLRSAINDIIETVPKSFSATAYEFRLNPAAEKYPDLYPTSFVKNSNIISFAIKNYDKTKTLIVDPFVSSTANLTGTNNGVAKDVDFDYDGNIYVAGGGDNAVCKLAKYDAAGVLQWTFNGTSPTPPWTFGSQYGGWVVEKTTGNIYMGQGAQLVAGSRIIRLDNAGVYDNYITNANPNFQENWKMLWSCNGGFPQILVLGGSITQNLNFAICTPPLVNLSSSNITGVSTAAQDVADIVIDPLTNDMYTILSSAILSPSVNNRIYKNPPPYTAFNIAWSTLSGFTSLVEAKNRPYLSFTPGSFNDNSINAFAINSWYLFYWDGLNLKAFNKPDGSTAGTPLTLSPNTLLLQGGIVADECNNIFIGDKNGTIKVYKFNGSIFDDAAVADITVPGFPAANIYDLAYDQGRQLLYASGKGFVGSFDISSYCTATTYTISVSPFCPSLSAQAALTPTPPPGTVVTYTLFDSATQIASNSTGLFTGLIVGTNYTVKVFLDQACGGIQLIRDFDLNNCLAVTATFTDPTCNVPNGTIDVTANFGIAPYQFSKDGVNFQPTGLFTGLAAGSYTITAKDALNNTRTVNITLTNFPPPQLQAIATMANCNISDGAITATATGGTAPLQYSIDGTNFQASNIFTGLSNGNYTVTVKDANACIVTVPVTVPLNNTLSLNAGNDLTICEGSKKIIAASSNGISFSWSPATDLDNPAILNPEASPAVTTLYTLSAINGTCTGSSSVTVFVRPAPSLFAGNDTSIAINQPLQLQPVDINNTGFTDYNWSPSYGLNDPLIKDPVAVLDRDITYTLTATIQNATGCFATDDIRIKVFEGPAIYVPNAFTPNNDNKNDILKAIPIGLKEFKYFTIYNRYGQQVFTTSDPAIGWDGSFKGAEQSTGTYVWMAEGIDYRGNILQEKGSVILIR